MNLADPVTPAVAAPDPLFAPGRRAACIGAVALISMLAFESIAVATAMPAVATALNGLPLYALAFGATLATSVLGMTAAGPTHVQCRRDPIFKNKSSCSAQQANFTVF